jgi:hypothetical protein
MPHVTVTVPDELLAALEAPDLDLPRAVIQALTLDAYRTRKISSAQLRRILGFQTRMQVDGFLKEHGVALEYTQEDLDRDRETHRQLEA